jgi:hypothetical protein
MIRTIYREAFAVDLIRSNRALWLPKTNAGSSTIFCDKLDAGLFEGAARASPYTPLKLQKLCGTSPAFGRCACGSTTPCIPRRPIARWMSLTISLQSSNAMNGVLFPGASGRCRASIAAAATVACRTPVLRDEDELHVACFPSRTVQKAHRVGRISTAGSGKLRRPEAGSTREPGSVVGLVPRARKAPPVVLGCSNLNSAVIRLESFAIHSPSDCGGGGGHSKDTGGTIRLSVNKSASAWRGLAVRFATG